MEIKIQSIHFDASEQLETFIEKKVSKLEKLGEEIRKVEVSLKVVKPETVKNKQAGITLFVSGEEIYAEKVCDTFEEATDLCVDAVGRQFSKYKEKQRNK